MVFSPLNKEKGRKLNVSITRAKLRCQVFTNIISENVSLGRPEQFGTWALKNFLYVAQHGKSNVIEEENGFRLIANLKRSWETSDEIGI